MAASCRKFGKRPALIFSMTLAFVGSILAAASKGLDSFIGARWLQGMSMAFFESIMFSVVGDMYYVHERGLRTSAYIIMFSGISSLPLLVSGKVDEALGWRWIFWLLAIFSGFFLLLCVVFGWETTYNRDAIYDVDNSSQDVSTSIVDIAPATANLSIQNLQMINAMKTSQAEHKENKDLERIQTTQSTVPPARQSFVRRMAPWSGQTYSNVPLTRLILSPLLIIYNPAVIWASITIAFPVLWLVGITVVVAQIFSSPPYSMSPKDIGYLSAGPIVAGMLANIVIGSLSDWSVKLLSRRNRGLYEPEFRLFIVVGLFICAAIGYFLIGYLISEQSSTVGISVAYGITLAGCQFSAVAVGTYIVDAYRAISVDVFINAMVFKNFLFFGFTCKSSPMSQRICKH